MRKYAAMTNELEKIALEKQAILPFLASLAGGVAARAGILRAAPALARKGAKFLGKVPGLKDLAKKSPGKIQGALEKGVRGVGNVVGFTGLPMPSGGRGGATAPAMRQSAVRTSRKPPSF